jgi:phage terminase small subunit
MTLSNKRQAFVNEYLVDFNATQSAIRAGYAKRSARQMANRLLTKDDIKAEIKARLEEKAMTADEVLRRLADIARGDIGELMDIESMSFDIDLQKAKEKGLTKLIKKVKQVTKTTSNRDGEEEETNIQEIELYSAPDALVQLGRYHKLFTDKTDITSGGKTIEVILKKRDE